MRRAAVLVMGDAAWITKPPHLEFLLNAKYRELELLRIAAERRRNADATAAQVVMYQAGMRPATSTNY